MSACIAGAIKSSFPASFTRHHFGSASRDVQLPFCEYLDQSLHILTLQIIKLLLTWQKAIINKIRIMKRSHWPENQGRLKNQLIAQISILSHFEDWWKVPQNFQSIGFQQRRAAGGLMCINTGPFIWLASACIVWPADTTIIDLYGRLSVGIK